MNRKQPCRRPEPKPSSPEPRIPELYQVVVRCADESDQRRLYERLTAENRTCRLVIL
ncbi:MAG: hypothetical protein ACYC6Y_01200 [Thermoguttaceae bacterium]